MEFENKNELWIQIPSLFDKMMGNVWGNGRDAARDERIAMAWSTFDELEKKEGRASTKAAIENTLIRTTFTERPVSYPHTDVYKRQILVPVSHNLFANSDTLSGTGSISC